MADLVPFSFACPMVTFRSFVLVLVALFLQGTFHWDVTSGSASGAVGLLGTVLFKMTWLLTSKTGLVHR